MTEANVQSKAIMSRRNFLKLSGIATAQIVLLGTGGLFYSTQVEPNAVSITNINVPIKNLPDSFAGYRIAQISDIHAGTWMNQKRLMTIVDLINQQQPDLVAITGDYITRGKVNAIADILIAPLSQLQAPDGVVSVLGNHDYWTNAGAMREILGTVGIQDLQNDFVMLERDFGKLAICGVDDVWERKADLDRIIERLPNDDTPAILLAHEPDFADQTAETGRFALQMSGHSHGGQIRLPVVGALILPRLGRKYSMGQYRVRDMIQYTNRGVGMVPPTVRLGCPPEITIFTLIGAMI